MTFPFLGRHNSEFFRKEEGASTERVSMDTLERWLTVPPTSGAHSAENSWAWPLFEKANPLPQSVSRKMCQGQEPEVAWDRRAACCVQRGGVGLRHGWCTSISYPEAVRTFSPPLPCPRLLQHLLALLGWFFSHI